jgi:hypothetical protein
MTDNPFREMAAAMRTRNAFGDSILLLFKKGDWTAGPDAIGMNGRRLVALVDETMYGWSRWENKRATDYIVGRVADRYRPPRRSELGDTDKSVWDFDKDPWQLGYFLPLADPDKAQLYIYATSTRGGKDAVANVLEAYADFIEQEKAAKLPLIELSADHYKHPEFDRVEVPVFEIMGWVDRPKNIKQIKAPPAAAPLIPAQPQIEHAPAPAPKRTDFDDAIPF